MTDIARATGLSRGSLYAALNREGNPSLDTIMKMIDALQLELRADAKDAAAQPENRDCFLLIGTIPLFPPFTRQQPALCQAAGK
jgi:transcriptional regulator with XRE-family HTH domain